jgi:hypothetical protein
VDITKYPTLSSIAFAVYRSNFMDKDTIINITNTKLHFTLKEAYYGGICDIYKPEGKNIHSYDVNSLYPDSMCKFDMPIGKPIHVIGDPYKYDSKPFGFFYVNVNAPNINIPLLPHRLQTSGGIRTVFPTGS